MDVVVRVEIFTNIHCAAITIYAKVIYYSKNVKRNNANEKNYISIFYKAHVYFIRWGWPYCRGQGVVVISVNFYVFVGSKGKKSSTVWRNARRKLFQ